LIKYLHASVGYGGLNPVKNGPGGAVLATLPAGRLGASVAIGVLLGPLVEAASALVEADVMSEKRISQK
jgi:hypothetical protein